MRSGPWFALILTLTTFGAACTRPPAAIIGTVEGVRVRIEPTVDGSLRVMEDYTLRADGAGAIRFIRTARTREADGLELSAVAIDGSPVASGTSGVDVQSTDSNEQVISWRNADGGDRPRRFTMVFRAVSAIAVTEPRAMLSWPVLETGRPYDVGPVEIVMPLTPDVTVYPGTGIAEAGWTVDWTKDGVTAKRDRVPGAEGATFLAVFDFDRRGVRDPVWERNRDRQRQFWPAFLAGGLFFLVIGVGTIVILRMQYPRVGRGETAAEPAPSAAEREVVVRGLRQTGYVGIAMAAACALVGYGVLGFLGPWLHVIPGSMFVVSIAFIGVAGWFRR